MGKVVIAIQIEDESAQVKFKNIGASHKDISLSLSVLESVKNKQLRNFERTADFSEEREDESIE